MGLGGIGGIVGGISDMIGGVAKTAGGNSGASKVIQMADVGKSVGDLLGGQGGGSNPIGSMGKIMQGAASIFS